MGLFLIGKAYQRTGSVFFSGFFVWCPFFFVIGSSSLFSLPLLLLLLRLLKLPALLLFCLGTATPRFIAENVSRDDMGVCGE